MSQRGGVSEVKLEGTTLGALHNYLPRMKMDSRYLHNQVSMRMGILATELFGRLREKMTWPQIWVLCQGHDRVINVRFLIKGD